MMPDSDSIFLGLDFYENPIYVNPTLLYGANFNIFDFYEHTVASTYKSNGVEIPPGYEPFVEDLNFKTSTKMGEPLRKRLKELSKGM